MMPSEGHANARTLTFMVLGAALTWAAARFVWPLCGPHLLEPCPLPTPAGCVVAFIWGALWGVVRGIELEVRSP